MSHIEALDLKKFGERKFQTAADMVRNLNQCTHLYLNGGNLEKHAAFSYYYSKPTPRQMNVGYEPFEGNAVFDVVV